MATRQGFARSDRISEQIRRELAELLRFGLKDPRLSSHLSLVTITDVETTRDYSHAKIFFTSLSPAAATGEITAGLKRSAGFLRRELGKRIRLHKIPELHFVFDASVENGSRLSRLIDQAVESDVQRGSESLDE
ncbi:MAG: 30S ribosome-binding factor RbfA [Rhodocyclaceae bacterium]|nr:30S ribosome-binding factor RbfA [Rhodocyclaceae bacterium]MBP7079978.1 30S ribosome-binding factor RbfA [Rhodocyclaceae bacterium]